MTKGTKNYFRHHFHAREDVKMQEYLLKVGPAGYLYYFTLCEIMAQQCTQEGGDPRTFKARVHPRNLASLWFTQRNKLGKILDYSGNILGIVWEHTDKEVIYHIPNLWKYLGSYSSLNDKLNEIKQNKIKLNEIRKNIQETPPAPANVLEKTPEKKVDKFEFETKEILDYLHSVTGRRFGLRSDEPKKLISKRMSEGKTIDEIKKVIDLKYFQWGHDEKMKKFLSPETIFGSKLGRYIEELSVGEVSAPMRNLPMKFKQKESAQDRQERILNYEFRPIKTESDFQQTETTSDRETGRCDSRVPGNNDGSSE